ncbi:hypothetical protein HU200_056390 [Digitaria exilis]|uniref:DUF4220 domain-containing protein n=1 Tax=Digitaria exilis TaxID=1010633 RepID=A0A835AH70_9POAL|nr:hypothetical protein HU200_056390 [Digitaria exilis]
MPESGTCAASLIPLLHAGSLPETDAVIASSISSLSKCGTIADARSMFDEMLTPFFSASLEHGTRRRPSGTHGGRTTFTSATLSSLVAAQNYGGKRSVKNQTSLGEPADTREAMGIKNSTITLAQSWGTTQGRLVRVEVLVLFSALIWILIEFFGSLRRRYSHGFFRFFVWAVYTLFTVLGPYTIGLLQDGPFRDQMFVLWGTILLVIQVSADSISVYSIHDIEQRKRVVVQHVLQIILVLWLILNCKGHNKSYSATIWIFWIHSVVLTYRKSWSLSDASKKGGLLKQSKVVADYMMIEHEQIPLDFDPVTMEGYKYIFHGEDEVASQLPIAPEYRVRSNESTFRMTTIDSIWRLIESKSFRNEETMIMMKDVALSFSLCKLLKRRLCGYQIGEAGLVKTLNFVLHGLLSEDGNYVRSFWVIETELAFLYDFLYTRFYLLLDHRGYKFIGFLIVVIVTILNSISGAFSRHYHRSKLDQLVHGINVTHWVTIVLLIIVLSLSTLVIKGMGTRWMVVDEICTLARSSSAFKYSYNEGQEKYWQRAMDQYSLILNFDYHPWNVLKLLSLGLIDATREGQKAGEKIILTDELIVRVLSGFKERNGQLEDGQSALARNQLLSQFSWACNLPTHIHKILVWHIGTTIAMEGHPVPPTGDHRVAKTLSDYCAYLVAFVPDMLPGHGYDTQRIFDAVVVEARERLTGCDTLSSRCEKLMVAVSPSDTILELGSRLGRELRSVFPEERRWKVLADFWAEFILFLAPSSNVEIHAEKLAAGGEFMTHLWALLTHAGILDRPSTTDAAAARGNSSGAPAHGTLV